MISRGVYLMCPICLDESQSRRSMRLFKFGINLRKGNRESAILETDVKVFSRIKPRTHSFSCSASFATV